MKYIVAVPMNDLWATARPEDIWYASVNAGCDPGLSTARRFDTFEEAEVEQAKWHEARILPAELS